MKSLLSKIAIRKAVGLYIGEHEVTVCKVASTPLGPIQVASASEPFNLEYLADVIERLLTPLVGSGRGASVAVGLAGSRVFFGTRLTPSGGEVRPEAELQKALYSSNLSPDDLVMDLLRGRVNKLPVARMAACRAKYMANIVSTLQGIGVRPVRAEPAACALVRYAEQQHRPPRRSKSVLHIFLGQDQGLAVVVVGGLPLAWKVFALSSGMEGFSVISASRVLRTQQTHYGIETPLEYAIIQGRPDLHEDLQREQVPTEIGTRVLWHEGPGFDGANVAFGLALGCLASDIKAFDLSRTLKSNPPIKEIFPWKELAFALTMVGCMGGVMVANVFNLDESYLTLRAENGQHPCLEKGDPAQLEKEKKSMEDKIKAVRDFLETRTPWTTYMRDLSTRLPSGAMLTAFSGKNDLRTGRSRANGVFQVRGRASLADDGSVPQEIDAFLRELPDDPTWTRNFGPVTTDIKIPPAGPDERPTLYFSILAQCKAPTKPAKKK